MSLQAIEAAVDPLLERIEAAVDTALERIDAALERIKADIDDCEPQAQAFLERGEIMLGRDVSPTDRR